MIEASTKTPTPSATCTPMATANPQCGGNKRVSCAHMVFRRSEMSPFIHTPCAHQRSKNTEIPSAQIIIQGLSELVSKIADLVSSVVKLREAEKSTGSSSSSSGSNTGNTTGTTDPSASGGTSQNPTSATDKKPVIDLGTALRGSGEFLWKPKSEKDGKLAVLIPSSLTGSVSEVAIVSPDGKRVLQKGRYSGVGNGDRGHYRFSKAGGSFPDGAIVLVKLNDGTNRHFKIKETSQRVTS